MELKKIVKKIMDTIYPERLTCVFCGNEIFDENNKSTCPHCEKSLPQIFGKICNKCGQPMNNMANYCEMCKGGKHIFTKSRSAFVYEGRVSGAILNFKFHNAKYYFKPFAYYLAQIYKEYNYDCDVVIPVPIHSTRLIERGYNQSELMANKLCEILNLPLDTTSLIKIKKTKNQAELDFKQRQTNLLGAFKVTDKKKIKGKNILIIDDVYTTGATIDGCAVELFKAGAKSVCALTLAHAVTKLS